MNSKKN